KYFQIVRCYRPDVIDATHGVEFNQMGGFVIGKDLSFENLLGLLKQFVHELIGPYEVKFTTGYFPFTEPSCEISVKHPKLGWIESAGAGMFREELTKPFGVDVPVIAWGFGIDRLGMFKLGINDIREVFSRNLEWLRSAKDSQNAE
ncbi:MAG: phenylalanine--tRNA ligase subunit alpha, partial [Candidatus Aenigmatarchaeota archaeon]